MQYTVAQLPAVSKNIAAAYLSKQRRLREPGYKSVSLQFLCSLVHQSREPWRKCVISFPLVEPLFMLSTPTVMDNTQASLLVHLNPAIEFITKAREGGGNVLVHCFAGRSRR
jgi:hypothetical protein